MNVSVHLSETCLVSEPGLRNSTETNIVSASVLTISAETETISADIFRITPEMISVSGKNQSTAPKRNTFRTGAPKHIAETHP
jgi:hypothetical protein